MQQRWFGILIAGWMAGCGSSPAETSATVADHLEENVDVMTRSRTHPCGADYATDGVLQAHYTYSYDALGRSSQDLAIDLTGAVFDQIDYTWDNAGHLIDQNEVLGGYFGMEEIEVYDTLGRETQVKFIDRNIDPAGISTPFERTTYDYSNFDDLGHSAHADELFEDLEAGASQTLRREYGYDDLGRRTSLDAYFSSGDLYQGWTYTYDDVARTVTSTLNNPVTLFGRTGETGVQVNTYDAAGHFLSMHAEDTWLDGSEVIVSDYHATWDGDRQLTENDTFTDISANGDVFSNTVTTTFQYECDSARVASGPLRFSALPRPVHAVLGRRRVH